MMPDKELLELVQSLEPVLGPDARLLWYKYLMARSPERKELWRRRIRILAERHLNRYEDRIRLPPPPPRETWGKYCLGLVIYPDKPYSLIGLREEEWCKHVMITGTTGAGKTTAVFQMLRQLKRHGKNFIVFDWQREYKQLRKTEMFKDLMVLRAGKGSSFRFNPLIPPKGVDEGEWLTKLVDVINHAYLGSYGTEFILRDVIAKAYEHVKKQGEGEFPTFKLVKQYLKKNFFKGRMEWWNQTGIRILESLTYEAGLGGILNAQTNTSMKELLKQDIIIELDALSQDDKKFLTEALLLWIYEFRKSQGITGELRHAIVVEEAHNILSKKKEKAEGGETIMETTLRMIRKFGEAVIVVDQEPSKLSESIKANTNTKICFTLGNGKDIFDISQSMELSWEQRKFLDRLEVGHAMVKVKGRIESPVMVYFPKYEPPKDKPLEGGNGAEKYS
jgi:DNA helicase HerA-like ATPase